MSLKGSIYNLPEGGYDDFEGGHSFSLLLFKGGLWKIFTASDIDIRGGEGDHFFPEKEMEMKICRWMLI